MTEDGIPYPVATDYDSNDDDAPTLSRDEDDSRDTRKLPTKR